MLEGLETGRRRLPRKALLGARAGHACPHAPRNRPRAPCRRRGCRAARRSAGEHAPRERDPPEATLRGRNLRHHRRRRVRRDHRSERRLPCDGGLFARRPRGRQNQLARDDVARLASRQRVHSRGARGQRLRATLREGVPPQGWHSCSHPGGHRPTRRPELDRDYVGPLRAKAAGGAVSPGAEDGGGRAPRRGRRARLQQRPLRDPELHGDDPRRSREKTTRSARTSRRSGRRACAPRT